MRTLPLSLLLSLPAALLGACTDGAPTDDDSWRPGGKGDDTGVTLKYRSYDVLFTNPVCRESSPQFRVLEWVRPLGDGDEIFLAYLSFSNSAVGDALCAAAGRGVKITFVLDAPSTQSDRLKTCGATILLRGHAGSIGYAHNKIIMINPNAAGPADPDADYQKLAFSSGNMSSGVVTHHENWHFLEVARASYFPEAHRCLMDAQIDADASSSRAKFRTAMNTCRGRIDALEEDDIKAFFIPNRDDAKRATRYLLDPIEEAASVDLGAHRFGHTALVDTLEQRLADDNGFALRMVTDDDMYWLDPVTGEGTEIGSNLGFEADNVAALERTGRDRFEIRYLETNHVEHLLHHNKFLIYRDAEGAPFGLLAGAANLTVAGFNDNFENIYFIKVPHVLAAFDTQFERFWGVRAEGDAELPPAATPRHLMPASVEAVQ